MNFYLGKKQWREQDKIMTKEMQIRQKRSQIRQKRPIP